MLLFKNNNSVYNLVREQGYFKQSSKTIKMKVEITKEEAVIIFSWLRYKAHEVNIERSDIELLKKIEPLLSKDNDWSVTCIRRQYREQF